MPNIPLVLDHDVLTIGGKNDPLLDQLLYAINHATEIEIAVSFIQPSGLDLLLPTIQEAIERQEKRAYPLKLRLLTSDYLHITHPIALRSLVALVSDNIDIKIFETKNHSFHMKSYIFVRTNKKHDFFQGSAFIGSNNISKTALTDAHEWCIRYDYQAPQTTKEALQFTKIRHQFNDIFNHPSARTLTDEWIDHYIQHREKPIFKSVSNHSLSDDDPFTPNSAQEEALHALHQTREAGNVRGLVVLGTGMGKTWLSAFDAKQMNAKRVLFVAHRKEILEQACNTFAKLWPEKSSGYYHGKNKNNTNTNDSPKEMLFASVQTLSKQAHLDKFEKDHFDYIVVDEFHHASAATYLAIIHHFTPQFLLGLTATPERTDQANILSLCHDNLVFQRNLVHGIDSNILVPFHYYGIWDESVNYSEIPWRNGKFDPSSLDAQFATQKRAQHIFHHWKIHQQSRTLAFCVSKKHADFMAHAFNTAFQQQGFSAVSVHSDSEVLRNEALIQLDKGEISVIFSVDLFNEGTDLPSIDTVLMLRPTESNVIFLQQLGRGLRLHENKAHLIVLDFIGNHKSFLNKQEILGISTTQPKKTGKANKTKTTTPVHIAKGCHINIDPKITDFWEQLTREYRNTVEEDFLHLEAHLGHRPNATEFYRANYSFTKVNKQAISWFNLVSQHLDDKDHINVIKQHHDFLFHAIQTTSMSKSFKAILLEAFLELDGFRTPPTIDSLSEKSWHILSQYPYLKSTELPTLEQTLNATDKKWVSYWKKNPIKASTSADKKTNIAWFTVETNRSGKECVIANFPIKEADISILHSLVKELVDYRLAQYIDKKQAVQKAQKTELESHKEKVQSIAPSVNLINLPYYPNLKIACGHFKTGNSDEATWVGVDIHNVSPDRHFLAHASGNSMNGGKQPILDGDLLLLEAISPVSAGSITGNIMAIEMQDESGDDQYLLRVIEKDSEGHYWLKAKNTDYKTIPTNPSMKTFARLKQILTDPVMTN